MILSTIGNKIGRTVKVDKNTLQVKKGNYARIYVEVNLTKPLLTMFSIKGRMYKIEYEGLHLLCLSCARFGHYRERCPEIRTDWGGGNVEGRTGGNNIHIIQRNNHIVIEGSIVGPWIVVQKHKKGRKMMYDRRNQPLVITNGDKNIVGSKFVSLSEEILELNGGISVT